MCGASTSEALEFVNRLELPPAPLALEGLESVAEFDFDRAKSQAMIVGSDIVSFVQGVTEERRRDIVNSALLAQLVANKRVPDTADLLQWYDAYFDVLSNIGWVIQSRQLVDHTERSDGFEAHQAIMTVAASLLGPGAAAMSVIKATLDALKSMRKTVHGLLYSVKRASTRTARAFRLRSLRAQPTASLLL
jgi:hypothetical protein